MYLQNFIFTLPVWHCNRYRFWPQVVTRFSIHNKNDIISIDMLQPQGGNGGIFPYVNPTRRTKSIPIFNCLSFDKKCMYVCHLRARDIDRKDDNNGAKLLLASLGYLLIYYRLFLIFLLTII